MRHPFAFLKRRVPDLQTMLVRLVLAVYLPALLAGTAVVAIETRSTWSDKEHNLQARSDHLARAMRLQVQGIQLQLARLAEDVPATEGEWTAFDHQAREAAAAAGLNEVVLLRPGGEPVVQTRLEPGVRLPACSADALLKAARTGQAAVHDVLRSPDSGRWAVCFVAPVIRDGVVAYVLTGVMQVRRLQELLVGLPEGWIAAIVDAQGTIAARTPNPEGLVGRAVTPEFRRQLAGEENGVFESTTVDGIPVLTAFRKPAPWGWSAVVSVPQATLLAPVRTRFAYLAGVAAALLVAGLWLAMRVRRSIVRSVNTLVEEALEPPRPGVPPPLAFREANQLRLRLQQNAHQLARARREVERIHADFQRALMQQTEHRQAEIAAELHDNVGSTLAGATLLLAQVELLCPPATRELTRRVLQQLERASASIRQVSRGIMPAGEQQGALPAALEDLAADANRTGSRCSFRVRGDFSRLPAETAGHLFRIAQEAVTNSLRHTTNLRIRLVLDASGRHGRLAVDDDGPGFRPVDLAFHPGIGLRSMRTRALAVEGEIEFGHSPLGGARVRVTFPLAQAARKSAAQPREEQLA